MDNMFLLESSRHPEGFMNKADPALDGFTIQQVIDALHNESGTLTTEKLHGVVHDILDSQLQDLWAIINENDEEIIAAAYKGRSDDPYKTPSFDMDWADRAEALARDIYTWCIENDCWQDVYIYYNGKRMGTSGKDKTGKTVYCYGGTPFIEENMDPRDYFIYVREPNILSMSFEGTLYALNMPRTLSSSMRTATTSFPDYLISTSIWLVGLKIVGKAKTICGSSNKTTVISPI